MPTARVHDVEVQALVVLPPPARAARVHDIEVQALVAPKPPRVPTSLLRIAGQAPGGLRVARRAALAAYRGRTLVWTPPPPPPAPEPIGFVAANETTTATTGPGAFTRALPPGHAAGDMLLVLVKNPTTATVTLDPAATGWAVLDTHTQDGVQHTVYRKVSTGDTTIPLSTTGASNLVTVAGAYRHATTASLGQRGNRYTVEQDYGNERLIAYFVSSGFGFTWPPTATGRIVNQTGGIGAAGLCDEPAVDGAVPVRDFVQGNLCWAIPLY